MVSLSYSSTSPLCLEGEQLELLCVELGMLGCCPDPQAVDILDVQYQLSNLFGMDLCTANLCVL